MYELVSMHYGKGNCKYWIIKSSLKEERNDLIVKALLWLIHKVPKDFLVYETSPTVIPPGTFHVTTKQEFIKIYAHSRFDTQNKRIWIIYPPPIDNETHESFTTLFHLLNNSSSTDQLNILMQAAVNRGEIKI